MTQSMTNGGHIPLTLLMLAPLIAGSSSSGVALFLGLASGAVLLTATVLMFVIQQFVIPQFVIPQFVIPQRFKTGRLSANDHHPADQADTSAQFPLLMLVLSTCTTALMLVLQTLMYEATLLTGLWLPLISSNLLMIRHLLTVDGRVPFLRSVIESGRTALLFLLALTGLALARELLGHGSVLMNMHLFTDQIPAQGIKLISGYPRLKLFEVAPGALLLLACILAGRRAWLARHPQTSAYGRQPETGRRVRVTGKIS